MFYERQGSPRLPGYDYSRAGVYFVTFNVKDRLHAFGEIRHGRLIQNELGIIVGDSWCWLERQYPYVRLDSWILMPDHFHGIVKILGEGRDSAADVRRRKTLGRLIGAFKTTSTCRLNQICGTPGRRIWQHQFYDRILREHDELKAVRRYIRNNPEAWWKKHQEAQRILVP